jgi:hypothetical protein
MIDPSVWVTLAIGNIGVIIILVLIPKFTDASVGTENIQKNIIIFASATAVLIFITFAIASYIYFIQNLNYAPAFIIIMTFINLFLNGISTTASILHVTKT